MKKLNKNENGITLIALVVTIIVLLILAGIAINLVVGNNELFSRASNAGKVYKIAEIQEKLEMEKEPVFLDNMGKVTIQKYLDHIIEEGIIGRENIVDTENEKEKYITVEDEYVFLVEEEEEEDGNIKITYEGKSDEVDKEKPIIERLEPTSSTIKVVASDKKSGIIGYAVTTSEEKPTEFISVESTKKLEMVIENLEADTKYYVWVKDDAGNISEKVEVKTELTPTLSLSSESGKVLSGNSLKITINGINYGELSCLSSDNSIATASISENILTVTGKNSSGTQNATITVKGSKGATCTYTITSHVHSGNINGGGCYTKAYTVSEACGNTSFTTTSQQIRCNLICKNYTSATGYYVCDNNHGSACGNYGKVCGQVIGTSYTYTCKSCGQAYSSATSKCTKVISKTRYSINCGY